MSAKRHQVLCQVTSCKRILRVHTNSGTLELEGFSNESLYAAIDKAAWLAAAEGWHDWRLVEAGRVLVTGDEHGPL
jgi:hypothetical protein